MVTYRVVAYDRHGDQVKAFDVAPADGGHELGAAGLAHQVQHADGVTRVVVTDDETGEGLADSRGPEGGE